MSRNTVRQVNAVVSMVVHRYPPDADITAYRMAYRANYLSSMGFSVEVIAPARAGDRNGTSDGVVVHRVRPLGFRYHPDMDYTRLGQAGRSSLPGFLHPLAGFARWIPAVRSALRKLGAGNRILYTYNNPLALHLVNAWPGLRFRGWVAELRDPITNYEYSTRGWMGKLSDRHIERRVLRKADVVCMRKGIQATPDEFAHASGRIVQLPDFGVDTSLFEPPPDRAIRDGGIRGVFAGRIFQDMTLLPLDRAVREGRREGRVHGVRVFGPAHPEHENLKALEFGGYIPFAELVEEYKAADFVVVFDQSEDPRGQRARFVPSKLAELVAAQRPILFVGNGQSETARLIRQMEIGVCTPNDSSSIKTAIGRIAAMMESRSFALELDEKRMEMVDIGRCERAFADILLELQARTAPA